MKSIFFLIAISLAFFMTSCQPAQKIAYNVDNVKKYHKSSDISISIQQFEDMRSESEIEQTQLQAKGIIEKINGKNNCINAEKLYKIPVGLQMADIFAKHLEKKSYFSNVYIDQKEKSDYYITANLKHFYGAQENSTMAAVGAGFGLIGAIATAGLKTEGSIIIELSDICLYDKNDNLIAKVGDFKKEYTGKFPVNANCYCIYQNINQKLMEFNEELGKTLYLEVKNSKNE